MSYRQATQPGGIGSLESILGLLKSIKIRAPDCQLLRLNLEAIELHHSIFSSLGPKVKMYSLLTFFLQFVSAFLGPVNGDGPGGVATQRRRCTAGASGGGGAALLGLLALRGPGQPARPASDSVQPRRPLAGYSHRGGPSRVRGPALVAPTQVRQSSVTCTLYRLSLK